MNEITHDDRSRANYRGMLQILRFNWRLYLAGVFGVVLLVAITYFAGLNAFWKILAIACLAVTVFWMAASLAASHWVYDLSPICKWTWIADCLPQPPRRWANIHAGLDESSPTLKRLFPGASGEVLDIFDPREMSEASIAEARKRPANEIPAKHADLRNLPFAKDELDVIFLIFAAHEIRRTETRLRFFAELNRVLDPTGCIVIVEHLRDWKNFLAYGPGCFHFQSHATWLYAISASGLTIEKEFSMTPFVRIFIVQKKK